MLDIEMHGVGTCMEIPGNKSREINSESLIQLLTEITIDLEH